MMAPGRRAQFSVAIRTVLVDRSNGEAEYGVGGGVVWDSTPTGEYEECLLKARILTRRLPEFSLLESLLWTPEDGYFLLDEHLRRLGGSAEYFGFPSANSLRDELAELVASLAPLPHKVRVLVSREGKITCEATPVDDGDCREPVRLELACRPIDSGDPFLFHKTTHREVYRMAQEDCTEGDDVLLYNERGEITETCRGNVVVRLGNENLTPPLASGLLAGTYRERLLAEGKIRERPISLDALALADELFFINSVRRWRTARLVGPRDPRSVFAAIQEKAP
jgi:para-aminobenzoate synthetase/4-amino-4-deoxychorismate lyase